MKKLITLLALCCAAAGLRAQSVGINTAPAASAALDVASQSKGVLVPRMNTTARNSIVSPQKGLMVFDSVLNNFYFYNGTVWTAVGGGSTSGAGLELVAKKISSTQTLSLANTFNTGDVVVFDNVATLPTVGSYSTSTNAYTVGTTGAGLYMVQVKFSMVQNSTSTNTTAAWSYVEVNGSSLSTNNVYSEYVTNGGGGSNLPTGGYKGLKSAVYLLYLNAGDYIKIKALGENSAASNALDNNGGCQFMVVKLN